MITLYSQNSMLIIVIVVLAIISVVMALFSLRSVLRFKELSKVKEDISKSKVLYQREDGLSSSSSSSEGETSF